MKISTRSLVRDFPRVKAAARKGQKVEIHDGRTGEAFFLTAKSKKTFGELAEMAKGVLLRPQKSFLARGLPWLSILSTPVRWLAGSIGEINGTAGAFR